MSQELSALHRRAAALCACSLTPGIIASCLHSPCSARAASAFSVDGGAGGRTLEEPIGLQRTSCLTAENYSFNDGYQLRAEAAEFMLPLVNPVLASG